MIPKSKTIADKIGQYLHKHGKCSAMQIRIAMEAKGHKDESVYTIMREMVKDSMIVGDNSGFELSDLLRKHYDYSAPEVYVGEVAGPRTANPFKPMTVTPWAQHIGRFRENVGFKNGSTDFRVGYLA